MLESRLIDDPFITTTLTPRWSWRRPRSWWLLWWVLTNRLSYVVRVSAADAETEAYVMAMVETSSPSVG